MKTVKSLSLLTLATLMMSVTLAKKESGDPVLRASAVAVWVNQEVTIKLSGIKSNCNKWKKISGPGYKTISGGRERDAVWTLKFNAIGTVVIQCSADNCVGGAHGGPCGHGCDGPKTATTTITVR